MADIEVYELDDDFDPLADAGLTADDEVEEHDYLAPIPDADKSVVPPAPVLSAEEKMEKLFRGIPGQKFRILRAVSLCVEPHTAAEVAESLEAEYPQKGSVYSPERLLELLVEAGGLECMGGEEAEEVELAEEDLEAELDALEAGEDAPEYLQVEEPAPRMYVATAAGLAMVDANIGVTYVLDMLREEPQYLPIYKRVLEMITAEGGATTADLNAAVDPDPLLVSPRRFCGYFTNRLEATSAAVWRNTWVATALGRQALESDLFASL